MTTQYNQIQAPYDELRKTTIAIVERVNIRAIVLPLIQGARVLELACGSGHYSRSFLKWGAKEVVAVDISRSMLQEARRLSGENDRIHFIEADCSKPVAFEGGPFDIVFGAWLLNYAATGHEMMTMYQNIALNLKDGGHFIGVTPVPTNDPLLFIETEAKVRPLPTASGGLFGTLVKRVDEGAYYHCHSDTPAGDLDFDSYYLKKGTWETAARDGGLHGELKWSTTSIPTDFMENPGKYGEDSNGGAGAPELETYKTLPHYGLLDIVK
ncbi:MAG: hypothetical protein M1821_001337 [Bathelium mastoideum]|nr:MAG: hypothetical protein M1821_001337 [Bathelium mastoideum]KAI9689862.1 MAG: hypothetical protein M1822_009744 [Bathelium mastoideum]